MQSLRFILVSTAYLCCQVQGEHADCRFEKHVDTCDWNLDGGPNSLWKIGQGQTDPAGLGPSGDHSYYPGTSGHYLYIMSSSPTPVRVGMSSIPIGRNGYPECFSLWYFMHGPNVGTLNIYAKQDWADPKGQPAWSISGDQGAVWHKAEITLNYGINDTSAIVIIEGVVGGGNTGQIAIDDIDLQLPSCNSATAPIVG